MAPPDISMVRFAWGLLCYWEEVSSFLWEPYLLEYCEKLLMCEMVWLSLVAETLD